MKFLGFLSDLVCSICFEDVVMWLIWDRVFFKKWFKGRMSFVGDVVYVILFYVVYGVGMFILDGYFIV